jgi:hypothetical protein
VTRRCALLAATAALLVGVPPAEAGAAVRCKSSDLRYPFQPGGPKTFGVFKLRTTGGNCRTARRVARAWMEKFEANIDAGRLELPRRVAGFRFKSLPPKEAQTYRLRGRRGATTIRFDYRVPNG